MKLSDAIPAWMRRQVAEAGAKGIVVGLSGGIDSAVTARLAQLAMPEGALGILLPCHSHPQDEADARYVAEHFGLRTRRVDLDAAFDTLRAALRGSRPPGTPEPPPPDDPRAGVPDANLKPRLRMTALYYVANESNGLVAGTGNRCEIAVGYFTKYGDGGVDILPLAHLLKSEVRALAGELGIPQFMIDKPPSAGLWPGQTDEGEMGFSYEALEKYLVDGPGGVSPALALRIERLIRASEHKRALPPAYERERVGVS